MPLPPSLEKTNVNSMLSLNNCQLLSLTTRKCRQCLFQQEDGDEKGLPLFKTNVENVQNNWNAKKISWEHGGEDGLELRAIIIPVHRRCEDNQVLLIMFSTAQHDGLEVFYNQTLLELGFINNTAERKKLVTSSYQNKLAKAIADGIEEYFERF